MAKEAENPNEQEVKIENVPIQKTEIEEFMQAWGPHDATIRDALTMMACHLLVSTISFYLVRHQIKGSKTNDLLDSFYFSVVTLTTVGYGDLVPNSVAAKILSSLFVVTGITLVSVFFTTVGDRLVKKQSILLVRAMQLPRGSDGSGILSGMERTRNRVRFRAFVAVVILCLHLVVGTLIMSVLEDLSTMDSIYTVCSTVSTLGYGDKSFATASGRAFAAFWILSSTLTLGQSFVYIAEDHILQGQRAVVEWILLKKSVSEGDIDDGFVNAAEFAIYKLKQRGKITQDDVSMAIND